KIQSRPSRTGFQTQKVLMIGQQSPAPELSGSAAQNRFNLLFQKFIAVFTTPEHPLVMFLDDLQWADSASLNLLKLLLTNAKQQHLFIIGAYRDNEVFPAHPLMLTLDEIQTSHATIETLTLAPLSQSDVNQLIADTFSCTNDLAFPFAELVYQKTGGNPFFTTNLRLSFISLGTKNALPKTTRSKLIMVMLAGGLKLNLLTWKNAIHNCSHRFCNRLILHFR
ncbi:MAG: AAA family ATPase, partial [Jaaginema sp. PMC 1079.18]|nr:AAA family ATPase [Jaaginema sp. PMC 1080.18]MEC4853705.1 AAA family ATPase [Jaaginema sp. PMC 1079.18]MEC4869088.1 AAA family ATPase [Jaaginema sp. PMC 1078.18]